MNKKGQEGSLSKRCSRNVLKRQILIDYIPNKRSSYSPAWPCAHFRFGRRSERLSRRLVVFEKLVFTLLHATFIYSRGDRSVPKIFDQFICSSLAVPLINSSYDSSNFEKFVKMFTTSFLLTILNQNVHDD